MAEFELFGRMEREGWSDPDRACGYVDLFASASDQAIDALLDAVGSGRGMNALDLCCGQGNVSDALVRRGCDTVGLDFSPAMLDHARKRAPDAEFHQGDAQDLPYEDGRFDVVVSNFGICHVPDQAKALGEVRRVLKPGGRFAMTVWCGPDQSPAFRSVYEVIGAHGSPDVVPPPAPNFHQFADEGTAVDILRAAGFEDFAFRTVPCAWKLADADGLFRIFREGTVRAAMLLADQPEDNLSAIRAGMKARVTERFAVGDHWEIPVPAALVSAG